MPRLRRRTDPGLRFIVAIAVLSILVVFGILKTSIRATRAPDPSLVSRDLVHVSQGQQFECRHVRDAKDQCRFFRQYCDDEDSGLFSYLDLYYCRLPHLKPLAFGIIIVWAALLFTTIGVAASEFFSVNLSTIAALLRLSENVAGVTFLAFGNGSADVFSTFAAMKSNSGSLAVGELIGAAGFISAVVPGTMALIRPFKTGKSGFVRDVALLAVAVSFSMVFLVNGRLEWWECLVMIIFYICYATMVVVWHWWKDRRRRERERVALARAHFTGSSHEDAEVRQGYRDDDSDDEHSLEQAVYTDDMEALEDANLEETDDDTRITFQERERWLGELSSNMRVTRPAAGDIADTTTPIRPSLIGALEFQALLASLQKARHSRSINLRRYSDDPTFTALQQQRSNGHSHDPEPASDENTVLRDYGLSKHGPSTTLEARANAGGRMRAVSASDGARLHLDPRAPLVGARGGTRTRSRTTSSTSNPLAADATSPLREDARQPKLAAPSPLLTISEPDTEVEDAGASISTDHTAAPPSIGYLAPPGEADSINQRDIAHTEDPNTTAATTMHPPKLKITPPGTPSRSRRSSPRPHLRSPLAPYLDDEDLRGSGVSGLYLGEPAIGSPEPLLLVNSQDRPSPTSKPLRWWPYSVLPAPSVMVRTLFPTLYMWPEKTIWQKLLGIASFPSLFLLTITLPVVQKQESEKLSDSQTPYISPQHTFHEEPSAKLPLIDRERDKSSIKATGHYGSTATAAVSIEEETVGRTDHADNLPARMLESQHPHDMEPLTTQPKEWNRWLTVIQCFTAPWFVVLVTWANVWNPDTWILLKASLYSILGSLIALVVLLLTTTPTRPPRWRPVLSFVGFFVAVAWISTIADEVVAVLKTIGVICNISDAILGLTIFAVGNSLGDLVADITVARLGHPVMALSACFGGPMLNILLGIGLSGLYVTIHGAQKRQHKHPDRPWKFKPFHIDISTTLLISAGSLLVTLLALLVFVPLNKWKIDRRIGIGLICLWTFATVANVAVELTGISELVVA